LIHRRTEKLQFFAPKHPSISSDRVDENMRKSSDSPPTFIASLDCRTAQPSTDALSMAMKGPLSVGADKQRHHLGGKLRPGTVESQMVQDGSGWNQRVERLIQSSLRVRDGPVRSRADCDIHLRWCSHHPGPFPSACRNTETMPRPRRPNPDQDPPGYDRRGFVRTSPGSA